LAYSIHLHHLTEILSQPRSASRILYRSRSFHFLGWDRPISFLPGIGTHTRSLLFPRTSQVFEAEGELDSHSLAGKKRVDQATTEAEDRSQDGW